MRNYGIIIVVLCFSSVMSDETLRIDLDEIKFDTTEDDLTSKEHACENNNETTTVPPEPLREIVSDETDRDTFTIRSDVGDFHETVLQLESQSSPSKDFQFLKLQSRGETVLKMNGDGTLETSDIKISPRSQHTGSSFSIKSGRIDVEKSDVKFSDSTISISSDEERFLRIETATDKRTMFEIEGNGRMNVHRGGVRVEAGGLSVESGGLNVGSGGLSVDSGGLKIGDGGLVTASTAGLGLSVTGGGLLSTDQQNAPALRVKSDSSDFINTIAVRREQLECCFTTLE